MDNPNKDKRPSKWRLRDGGTSVTSIKAKSSTGSTYLKPILKVRSGKEIEEFKKDLSIDDHYITLDELSIRYHTDIENGLSKVQAEHLLKTVGPNCLIPSATTPKIIIFLRFLFGGFNALMWIGAVLTFIGYGISYSEDTNAPTDSLYLAVVLILVAVFTGWFSYHQESTNSAIMESFKKMVPKFATVIRDGKKFTIPCEEIVPGDLVEVKPGDIVPADIRIINSTNMKVDNSAITGESHPKNRSPECTNLDPLETVNLAFYSTSVLQGTATGVVIKCGDDTVIGSIAGLTSSIEKSDTLIHKELNHFIKIITILALMTGSVLFIISMIIGYGFFKSFSFFIAIVIANVPEGIPVCMTACMSLTAKRMAKKNCLVKKLECIETLGACNVICSDKTGTLTQNVMTASHLFFDGTEHDMLCNAADINRDSEGYQALCNVAILCSQAVFTDKEDLEIPTDKRKTTGDASEAAILKIMEKLEGKVEEKRRLYPKVCEIPFNSVNKYQLSIHVQGKGHILVMKGAPEKVLERCNFILRDSETLEISPNIENTIRKAIEYLGKKGERILAFADLQLPDSYDGDFQFDTDIPNFPTCGLRFVGMISLTDPPRPSVPDAVSKCRSAGIQVIMVTGDHPVTAATIARKVGIISQNAMSVYDFAAKNEVSLTKVTDTDMAQCTAAVITGAELRETSQEELERTLKQYKEIVFARTSPQQKLKIVEALQKLNKVVAVTGDGVNDSPALKQADIGIAMGITGSDVSKEAADMILLDDNFSSIVTGIEEGRLIFDNLKKCIAYELTSNVPEIAPFALLIALDIPEALSVMAIIVIDVGTDLWPAISLAYEKAETDIMRRNPRDTKKDKLINIRLILLTYAQIGVIQAVASFASYLYVMACYGFKWERLIGIRFQWESKYIQNLEDSYGQEWTYEQRDYLSRKCVTAYFMSIVITQVADLLICKTRKLSLLQQGTTNHVLNAGMMFEVFLAGFLVYCPGVNKIFQFEPIELEVLVPALPFALLIVLYDEMRKLLIRKYPNGFVDRETYY